MKAIVVTDQEPSDLATSPERPDAGWPPTNWPIWSRWMRS